MGKLVTKAMHIIPDKKGSSLGTTSNAILPKNSSQLIFP